jgi:hypothetical protein
MEGGHHVDARTIKGVYEMNLKYINDFSGAFKVICLYDGMKRPALLAKIENGIVITSNEGALAKRWIKSGLPDIASKISEFIQQQRRN